MRPGGRRQRGAGHEDRDASLVGRAMSAAVTSACCGASSRAVTSSTSGSRGSRASPCARLMRPSAVGEVLPHALAQLSGAEPLEHRAGRTERAVASVQATTAVRRSGHRQLGRSRSAQSAPARCRRAAGADRTLRRLARSMPAKRIVPSWQVSPDLPPVAAASCCRSAASPDWRRRRRRSARARRRAVQLVVRATRCSSRRSRTRGPAPARSSVVVAGGGRGGRRGARAGARALVHSSVACRGDEVSWTSTAPNAPLLGRPADVRTSGCAASRRRGGSSRPRRRRAR